MSERECVGDGVFGDGAPDLMPPRVSRGGRRSGVILPGERDSDTALLEAAKATPRRSSIIKVEALVWGGLGSNVGWLRIWSKY